MISMHLFAVSLIIAAKSIHIAAAQAGCCSAWWIVPDGSILTRVYVPTHLSTTMCSRLVAPKYDDNTQAINWERVWHIMLIHEYMLTDIGSLHYVWPGMEPRNGSFVFQNVIGDQQPAGNWSFATWYGPYDTA